MFSLLNEYAFYIDYMKCLICYQYFKNSCEINRMKLVLNKVDMLSIDHRINTLSVTRIMCVKFYKKSR